ncbi:serine protease inhibitor Kazal-type 14 [Hippopotamus amphibius kiboko]|uniref:serine protease inhibitor Kazal-type 14 n=1 Tax=Hippopotamus amphibius kiboko TaxID=575201 RepID=UPI00259A1FE7|nr:serine protease inhibitor Kazal-type 14 [Hippopotamus amphibius kiboko]
MAKSFPVLCSLLFFTLIHLALPFDESTVKCPYKKVDLSWFKGIVNPCPGAYQHICGSNLVTYDNPCILCVESMKSRGKIVFLCDGKC